MIVPRHIAIQGVASQCTRFNIWIVDYDLTKLKPHNKRTGKEIRKKENTDSVYVSFSCPITHCFVAKVQIIKNIVTD
jgi:hypothetical protein